MVRFSFLGILNSKTTLQEVLLWNVLSDLGKTFLSFPCLFLGGSDLTFEQ